MIAVEGRSRMPRQQFTFVVAGETFTTKAALRKRCSTTLNKSVLTEGDVAFLLSLLETYHPEARLKVGVGVKRFFVMPDGYGGQCFGLERIDGTVTDWSFTKCIDPPKKFDEVRHALRALIKPQVIAFRDNWFLIEKLRPCAITGELVDSSGSHVDHRPPDTFDMLAAEFLNSKGLSFEQIGIQPTADGDTVTRLADDALAAEWLAFHRQRAVLQVVATRANLSQGKGRSRT